MYLFIQVYNTYQEKAFDRYYELVKLNEIVEPNAEQKARIELQSQLVKTDKSNKTFYSIFIGSFAGIAIMLIAHGFHQWHTKIQPLQDKAAELHINKMELEIKILNKQLRQIRIKRSK